MGRRVEEVPVHELTVVVHGTAGDELPAELEWQERALCAQTDPEAFRFVVVISPATYAFASLVVLGSAIAAAVVVRRKLDRADIVGALKARD